MQTPEQTEPRRNGAVDHPSAEEWMAYLYGEASGPASASIREHLSRCQACRDQHAHWLATKKHLSRWEVPISEVQATVITFPRLEKWAVAALLVLGLGFGIGRLTAPALSVDEVRARLEPGLKAALLADLKQQVADDLRSDWQAALSESPDARPSPFRRQVRAGLDAWSARTRAASLGDSRQLLIDFAETYRTDRQVDQAAMLTLFDRANRQHQAEHVSLRRAVETVAVVAADKFARTDTQLGELASYTQAKLDLDPSADVNQPFGNSKTKGN